MEEQNIPAAAKLVHHTAQHGKEEKNGAASKLVESSGRQRSLLRGKRGIKAHCSELTKICVRQPNFVPALVCLQVDWV